MRYDISLFSALFLTCFLLVLLFRRFRLDYGSRLFQRIIIVTLVMIVAETASWYFDRMPGPLNRTLNVTLNGLYAWLTPLSPAVWASYLDYRVMGSRERLRARLYYLHGMIASSIIMIVNLFTPVVFRVSAENVYERLSGVWLLYLVTFATLIYIVGVTFKNRDRLRGNIVPLLISLVAVPAVAAIVQLQVYGIFIIWPLMTIVVILSYVFLESHNASIDYLTGLFTRMRADGQIRHLVESQTQFSLIILDVDDFKLINDQKGHLEGDRALKRVAGALRVATGRHELLARFGGDEFVVISRYADPDRPAQIVDSCRTLLGEPADSYPIGISAGWATWTPDSRETADELFSKVDAQMYSDKAERKNGYRRRTDPPAVSTGDTTG